MQHVILVNMIRIVTVSRFIERSLIIMRGVKEVGVLGLFLCFVYFWVDKVARRALSEAARGRDTRQ
jgi:hypothetical protein